MAVTSHRSIVPEGRTVSSRFLHLSHCSKTINRKVAHALDWGLAPRLLSIGFSPGDAWIRTSAPSLFWRSRGFSPLGFCRLYSLLRLVNCDVFEGHDQRVLSKKRLAKVIRIMQWITARIST